MRYSELYHAPKAIFEDEGVTQASDVATMIMPLAIPVIKRNQGTSQVQLKKYRKRKIQ